MSACSLWMALRQTRFALFVGLMTVLFSSTSVEAGIGSAQKMALDSDSIIHADGSIESVTNADDEGTGQDGDGDHNGTDANHDDEDDSGTDANHDDGDDSGTDANHDDGDDSGTDGNHDDGDNDDHEGQHDGDDD